MLPLAVDVVPGFDSSRVLLHKLEQNRDVIDLEVTPKNSLFTAELLFLPGCPPLEQEFALISDFYIAELLGNITLNPSGSDGRLQGLAAEGGFTIEPSRGKCSQGKL